MFIYFLFSLSLSISWHICVAHLPDSSLNRSKKKKEREIRVHFFESASRLTIFISCSDSHESCHSCFSSTHVHGACGDSWRWSLKRMQWSERESQTKLESSTNTHSGSIAAFQRWCFGCVLTFKSNSRNRNKTWQQKVYVPVNYMYIFLRWMWTDKNWNTVYTWQREHIFAWTLVFHWQNIL